MPPRKSLPIEKAATVAPSTKDSSPLPSATQPTRATSVPEGAETVEAGKGGHPHTSTRNSGINLEDLNLPKSIVSRLAKETLPTGTAIQATAILGIQKSATVFINYLANQANEYAIGAQRKTVSPQDVLKAIEEVGFGEWRAQLEQELRTFEANAKAKRDKNKGGKTDGEEGEKEARPRKKLKGHKGEVDEPQEETQEVELGEEEEPEEEPEEKVDGEDEEGDEVEEEDEEGEEEQDGNEDDDEEDEELRVRGKSEDEALDNGDDSD